MEDTVGIDLIVCVNQEISKANDGIRIGQLYKDRTLQVANSHNCLSKDRKLSLYSGLHCQEDSYEPRSTSESASAIREDARSASAKQPAVSGRIKLSACSLYFASKNWILGAAPLYQVNFTIEQFF